MQDADFVIDPSCVTSLWREEVFMSSSRLHPRSDSEFAPPVIRSVSCALFVGFGLRDCFSFWRNKSPTSRLWRNTMLFGDGGRLFDDTLPRNGVCLYVTSLLSSSDCHPAESRGDFSDNISLTCKECEVSDVSPDLIGDVQETCPDVLKV